MRRKLAALALAGALLGGCSGAQYMLPQLSEADVAKALHSVNTDVNSIPVVSRNVSETYDLLYRISNRLVPASLALCAHAQVADCHFPVIFDDDDNVNAYANEKREIHISRGLLERLASEEEIAAVIAHEMGHHIAEHVDETQENVAIGAIAGAILAGAVLAVSGYEGSATETQQILGGGAAVGAMAGQLSYSKDQEREADLLAAYILERSDYDLRRAGNVFKVLARLDSSKTHSTMFDTHPAGPERVAAWEKAIAEVEASPDKLPRGQ